MYVSRFKKFRDLAALQVIPVPIILNNVYSAKPLNGTRGFTSPFLVPVSILYVDLVFYSRTQNTSQSFDYTVVTVYISLTVSYLRDS
jgi:hypothetical protein